MTNKNRPILAVLPVWFSTLPPNMYLHFKHNMFMKMFAFLLFDISFTLEVFSY